MAKDKNAVSASDLEAAREAGKLTVATSEEISDAAARADAAGLPILVTGETLPVLSVAGYEYEIVNQVTRPVLQQLDDTAYFIKFDGPIVQAAEQRGAKESADEAKRPPKVAPIVNLETGQLQTLVCGVVLAGEIEEKYPDRAYIGRAYRLISRNVAMKNQASKRIRLYDIVELRLKN